MRYLIALFVPPLAILLCGRFFQFLINGILWAVGIVGLMAMGLGSVLILTAMIHALLVVSRYYADKRNDKLIAAVVAK